MKKSKLVLYLMCILLLFPASVVFAGGEKEEAAESAADVAYEPLPYETTFEFTILEPHHSQFPENPLIWGEPLEDKINAKINWIKASMSNYTEKLNTTLASGNLPDLVYMEPNDLFTWIKQGAVIPLDDLLKKYGDNIGEVYTDEDFSYVTYPIDGKIYGIAQINELSEAYSTNIRRDWLNELGLEEPETMDEWIEVLRQFKENDMAGNNSTIPWGGWLDAWYFAFGIKEHTINNDRDVWTINDMDEYQVYYEHKNYRHLLETLNMLYEEGLIDKEFFIRNKDWTGWQEIFANAQAGAGGTWAAIFENMSRTAQEIDPDVYYQPVPPMIGPYGHQQYEARERHGEQAVITIDAEKNGKAANVMRFVDWCFSEDGAIFWNWGLEGTHHEMVNGKPQLLPPYNSNWPVKREEGLNPVNFAFHWRKEAYVQTLLSGQTPEELSDLDKITYNGLFVNTPYLFNPVRSFDTPTNREKGADIYPFLRESEIKTIIGEITIDQFFDRLAEVKEEGLDQITKEMNEMYEATK